MEDGIGEEKKKLGDGSVVVVVFVVVGKREGSGEDWVAVVDSLSRKGVNR